MCGARYRRVVVKHRPNGGPVGPVEQADSVLTDHSGGMCGEDPLGSQIERFDLAASIDRNDGLRHVLQHGADARFALVLDHICLAQFDGVQLVHGLVPKIHKRLQVGRRHLPQSTIEDVQRADSVSIRSGKRLPGIEADSGRIGDERIIDEARVEPRVGNDQWVGPLKRVGTKGHATRRLGRHQSLAGLKPLSVDIDEAHERNRHVEKPLGDPRDAIKALLGGVSRMLSARSAESRSASLAGNGAPIRRSSFAGTLMQQLYQYSRRQCIWKDRDCASNG